MLAQSGLILRHTLPMLIAQLASMGMMVIDTVLLGHYGTADLAAVAVGSGIYIAVVLALAGVLQAVSPVVSHLRGARRDSEIAGMLHQCYWLALLLSVPGVLMMRHPGALLGLSPIGPEVEGGVRSYLSILAWAIPAVLLYRSFYAFCNALGRPRVLMVISLGGTVVHGFLASWLVHGGWSGLSGVAGCAVSNVVVGWLAVGCGLLYMRTGRAMKPFRLFHAWQGPRLTAFRELLRLGLPMGLSNLVEISAFTFMALFIAQLGAGVVAGHRVVANLAAVCYMLPLSLALATLAQVGLAAGAQDWKRARGAAIAGLLLAGVLATSLGIVLWLGRESLIGLYSDDPAVRRVALSLIGYVAFYQLFDAVQTVAAFALRGYKITFLPMLVHVFSFWGVGLFGGWWLAFHATKPLGAGGFWLASLASLVLASLFLGGLLWRAVRERR